LLPDQTLAVELAGDLMFLLPPSSLSSYSIPLRFVEDWATMMPLFCRELEQGRQMKVHRVGDTFIVTDPAPGNTTVSFSHPHRPMMMWVLLTIGDRRVDVRFHHPPSSFALDNKAYIMAAVERGVHLVEQAVNTRRLLTRLEESRMASPLLIPVNFGKDASKGVVSGVVLTV
jgi:hypothetical protein